MMCLCVLPTLFGLRSASIEENSAAWREPETMMMPLGLRMENISPLCRSISILKLCKGRLVGPEIFRIARQSIVMIPCC